jgi:hypothetical protein
VIRNHVPELLEPEERKLCEHLSFIGNGRGQNHVEGREPVSGDDEQAIAKIVDITNFASASQREPGEIRLQDHRVHLRRCHRVIGPFREAGILAQEVRLSTGKKNEMRKTRKGCAKLCRKFL